MERRKINITQNVHQFCEACIEKVTIIIKGVPEASPVASPRQDPGDQPLLCTAEEENNDVSVPGTTQTHIILSIPEESHFILT